MKDLIYYVLIGGLFVLNIVSFYKSRKRDNFVYRVVLFSRHIDWLLAAVLILFILTLAVLIEPYMPKFLEWGLFSLLDKNGTNANIEIMNQSLKISPIILVVVFSFLMFFVPKVAYWEEMMFRNKVTEINKNFFLKNIKFGLMHCIVGVPIWIGLLLVIVGFIYSLKYIYSYKKFNDIERAVYSSTSLHGKYNIILVILLFIGLLIKY